MSYLGQVQNLDWVSPSRIFATTVELFDSQPNYEHEVAIALDTGVKYQGIAPVVGGWGFATGVPGPAPAPVPLPINDEFTKLLLEFNGIEGSTTYPDTNAAGWPRVYKTQAGFGGTTNVGEKFPPGALRLDGKTVITAPDENRFDFADRDFTIRGWFLCDFPIGNGLTLAGKMNQEPAVRAGPPIITFPRRFMFWIDRTYEGFINVGVDTREIMDRFILDRFGSQILDRQGELVISRFTATGSPNGNFALQSTTKYSDTINPGWHKFSFGRFTSALYLRIDDLEEDSADIGAQVVNQVCGPITIGGYGPPINGVYQGQEFPWRGGLDRFAIDIGIAR